MSAAAACACDVSVRYAPSDIGRVKKRQERKKRRTMSDIDYTSSSFPKSSSSLLGPDFSGCINDAVVGRLPFACHHLNNGKVNDKKIYQSKREIEQQASENYRQRRDRNLKNK